MRNDLRYLVEKLMTEDKNSKDEINQKVEEQLTSLGDSFVKKQVSKIYTKDEASFVTGKRINSTTGDTPSLASWSYIELNVEGYTSISFKGYSTGSNNLGYAFYDSSNLFISGGATNIIPDEGYNVSIPDNAIVFRYGMANTAWEDVELNKFTLINSNSEFTTLKESVESFEEKISNFNSNDYMLPLGDKDNLLTDIYLGYGKYTKVDGTKRTPYGVELIENSGNIVGIYNDAQYFTSINNLTRVKGTMFLRIKKNSNSSRYIWVRDETGANGYFSQDDVVGTIVKQNVSNNPVLFGEVKENSKDYITVYFYPTLRNIKVISYTDSSKSSYDQLELDIERSAIFLETLEEIDIDFNRRYYSRSEKLNSLVRGKTAIVFSDSQSSFTLSLAGDFGMNIITIAAGGCRMGYELGSGAGGETGSADDLWLCNDTRIQQFNTNFGSLINVDYIINATGFNGTLSDISNATELEFVLLNKRWFGDTSSTNAFDSLGDDDKARFTSQACYIAAFCSLINMFPEAMPVVCDLYRTGGSGDKFTDGKWNSISDLATAIYDQGRLEKSKILEQLSDQIGAIFVKASRNGLGVTNCPTYAPDGVHSVIKTAINFASNIVNTIGFPNYTGDRNDLIIN